MLKERQTAYAERDAAQAERKSSEEALRAAVDDAAANELKAAGNEAKAATALKEAKDALTGAEERMRATVDSLLSKEQEVGRLQTENIRLATERPELQAHIKSLGSDLRAADERTHEAERNRQSQVAELLSRLEYAEHAATEADQSMRKILTRIESDKLTRKQERQEDEKAKQMLESVLQRERYALDREREAHASCETHRQELLRAALASRDPASSQMAVLGPTLRDTFQRSAAGALTNQAPPMHPQAMVPAGYEYEYPQPQAQAWPPSPPFVANGIRYVTQ